MGRLRRDRSRRGARRTRAARGGSLGRRRGSWGRRDSGSPGERVCTASRGQSRRTRRQTAERWLRAVHSGRAPPRILGERAASRGRAGTSRGEREGAPAENGGDLTKHVEGEAAPQLLRSPRDRDPRGSRRHSGRAPRESSSRKSDQAPSRGPQKGAGRRVEAMIPPKQTRCLPKVGRSTGKTPRRARRAGREAPPPGTPERRGAASKWTFLGDNGSSSQISTRRRDPDPRDVAGTGNPQGQGLRRGPRALHGRGFRRRGRQFGE